MSIGLWVVVGICSVLTVAVAIIRALRPKQFDPVELDFDMRALKQIKQESEKERKVAKTRELANRQYSTSKARMDDDNPPGPDFFG